MPVPFRFWNCFLFAPVETKRQGEAFTGDMYLPDQVDPDRAETIVASWRKLLTLDECTVYQGYAVAFEVGKVGKMEVGKDE
ncbi:MAG: hypothetical protein ACYC4L_19520 [Chloroflexota bacterium]